MKKLRNQRFIEALLLEVKHRKAGQMKGSDGETIIFDDADQVIFLPLGELKYIKKKYIAPEAVSNVMTKTSNLNYGTYAELEFDKDGNIVDVTVLYDWMEHMPSDDEDEDISALI